MASRRTRLAGPRVVVPAIPSAVWDPASAAPSSVPTSSDVLRQQQRPSAALAADLEQAILATLTRPIGPGETHLAGNIRREHEVAALFAQLTPGEAFQLGRRLDGARAEDALAAAFRLLVVDRRNRLRAFLADAPRRAARGR